MRHLVCILLAGVALAWAGDPEPGYSERAVEGWRVLLEDRFMREDPTMSAAVLTELQAQLHAVARAVPAGPLEHLRSVPLWVNRHSGTKCMAFHPSADWLREHGFNPRMAGAIEIGDAANFLGWTRNQPWMVLHELAHAYHFHVLGFANAEVTGVWRAARESGAYDSVLHINGAMKRHYAMENEKEYFAELSEAYFGTNDFYPFVRAELRKHDPRGFELMLKMWGR